MRAMFVWMILAGLVRPGVQPANAQHTDDPSLVPTADQLTQLKNCRESILDSQSRPGERKRWLELLFTIDSSVAKDLVVELLTTPGNAEVQRATCEVIAGRHRVIPHRLEAAYVEPLLELLGSDNPVLQEAAAQALADFPGNDIPSRLGQLAAQTDAPMIKRLGAIDALASKVDRRNVVRELMGLLESGVEEISKRAAAALEPASREVFGTDRAHWRTWWLEKAELSEEAWLADRLEMYRDRLRRLDLADRAYREQAQRHGTAMTARLGELQREVFRALSEESRDIKLVTWLNDPLSEITLGALSIIKARIADEGQRPNGEILATMLRLLRDGRSQIRRETVRIVQNLNNSDVMDAVLAQLEREKDEPTRLAILKALGQLNNPKAIPALIRQIAASDSKPRWVREAATALGQVAGQDRTQEYIADAVKALRDRYKLVATDDFPLRAALLTAMAGVADPSFAPEFLDAIEHDEPQMLRPAIRGLKAVGDTSKLPRLRTLLADQDPLIRLAASEAIGVLGREDADLESLLTRLNPVVEPNEPVREAAWRAFRALASKSPIEARVKAAQRLRDMPELEIRYLLELSYELASSNGNTVAQDAIRDRISTILVAQGKYVEAIPHLRRLFEMRADGKHPQAADAGLRWLEAALNSPDPSGVGDIITHLTALKQGKEALPRVIALMDAYLHSVDVTDDPERTQTILDHLESIPADALGERWTNFLRRFRTRMATKDAPPSSASSP